MLPVCRKNKEINFLQDIGDSTSFDLKLSKDGTSPKLLWQCLSKRIQKSKFFITFGCLVSGDQPIINYKSRLRRKLTKTPDFSQILICHSIDRSMYMQLYSFVRRQEKYETYKQDTLSMSNAIRRSRLNHWTKDERNPTKLHQLFQVLQQVLFIFTNNKLML